MQLKYVNMFLKNIKMKKINYKKYILSLIMMIAVTVAFASDGPPNPGGTPVGGEDPLGGGAPIGGGTIILIALGVAYGGKKIYNYRKKEEEK